MQSKWFIKIANRWTHSQWSEVSEQTNGLDAWGFGGLVPTRIEVYDEHAKRIPNNSKMIKYFYNTSWKTILIFNVLYHSQYLIIIHVFLYNMLDFCICILSWTFWFDTPKCMSVRVLPAKRPRAQGRPRIPPRGVPERRTIKKAIRSGSFRTVLCEPVAFPKMPP